MAAFLAVSTIAPHHEDGSTVFDAAILLARVDELPDDALRGDDLENFLYEDDMMPPGDDAEYVEWARARVRDTVRALFIDETVDDYTIGSFGDGQEVILTGGMSSGDNPTESYQLISILDAVGLFYEPLPRPAA